MIASRVRAFARENPWLIAILVLAALVRVLCRDIPPGLNQDEASTGYDAFALLHYGVDRNGFHNPLVMVAWGSGMSALPEYLAALAYALFGFGVASLRAVNLAFALGALLAFYGIVRRINERLALIALFGLAVSPWHIMMSRWGHEANLFPSLFTIAVYLLVCARRWSVSLAAFLFALCLYTYAPAYAFVPIFCALALAFLVLARRLSWSWALSAVAIFTVTALPIFLFLVINQFHLESIRTSLFSIPHLPSVPRYQSSTSLFSGELWHRSAQNLTGFFQLLITQNDGLPYNGTPAFGMVYLFTLPLAAIGVAVAVKQRDTTTVLFRLWLFASVMLGAFVPANINRIGIVVTPIVFFAALGVQTIAARREVTGVLIAIYLGAFAFFTADYFTQFPERVAPVFFAGFADAIHAAARVPGKICVSTRVNQPYIFILFYEQMDPSAFFTSVVYENPGGEFQNVRAFDRYVFGARNCGSDVSAYLVERGQENQFGEGTVERFGRYAVVTRPAK